ncbi:MAG: uracil-DNA glycosylase [Solirubrobacterales bacterium]
MADASAKSTRRRVALTTLETEVVNCFACPRLVGWREAVAAAPPKRHVDETYWARPLPGWGDAGARIVVTGLAPAANGANRTGRMFTGDRSGDWLYRAMYRAGLASQPEAVAADDGLALIDAWVTAVVRCAPPDNKPTVVERDTCVGYLAREFTLLDEARVIVALGAFAWDGALRALALNGTATPRPKPKFGHGSEARIGDYTMLGSYHPSQQNTFTGRLTEGMLDAVFARAVELAAA